MRPAQILAALSVAGALWAPSPARADCLAGLEHRATTLTFDLQLELERQHALSRDEFGAIRRAALALEQHLEDAGASRCLRASRGRRRMFDQWARKNVRPLLASTHERLDWICTRHTRFVIGQERHRIEKAVAAGKLAYADKRAAELERALTGDRVIRLCAPVRDEVRAARDGLVAETRARAAVPRVSREAGQAFFEADALWQEARDALATSGLGAKAAPSIFEDDPGLARFRATVERCLARARSAGRLGASADRLLEDPRDPEREPVSLKDAAGRCRTMRDGAGALAQVARRHNAARARRLLERWKYLHLKGWDMQQAFARLGRPAEVERRGRAILWRYPCVELRFSARGRKLGRRRRDCGKGQETASATSDGSSVSRL